MKQVWLSVESTWQWLSPMHWVLIKIICRLLILLGSRFIMSSYYSHLVALTYLMLPIRAKHLLCPSKSASCEIIWLFESEAVLLSLI
jgi:hypothetical protein